LDALLLLQRVRRRLPKLVRVVADSLISSNPAHDASCAVWLGSLVAIWFVGWPLAWMLSLNITVGFLLGLALRCRSPREFDSRLKPRGRVSPSGLPCLELQLATVLWAMVIVSAQATGAQQATMHALAGSCVGSSALLLFLRLYAGTHTLLQLVASVGLGATSIPALLALSNALFPQGVDGKNQALNFILLMFAWVAYVFYQAENSNNVPFLRLPREECS